MAKHITIIAPQENGAAPTVTWYLITCSDSGRVLRNGLCKGEKLSDSKKLWLASMDDVCTGTHKED
jgi:hypothetical protein